MQLNLNKKKLPSDENLRLIAQLCISLANRGDTSAIEISDVLTNTKIGGNETIDASVLNTDINTLQNNQLVYDTNGILSTIYYIDKENSKVTLKTIHANSDVSATIIEPDADGKLYFRSRDINDTDGKWVEFTKVDGSVIEVNINEKSSSTDGNYIPKKREFVYETDSNSILIGDGATKLMDLKPFYSVAITKDDILTTLGYTPEDVLQKGQPNGYVGLDANGLVPEANLPANVTSSYSKDEIDKKDADTLTSATTLVNTEASTARTNETAIQKSVDDHVNNTTIHVTQTDKDNWDAKVDEDALSDYDTHISDDSIHVTQAEKDKWNGMNKSYFVDDVSELPLEDNDIGNTGYVRVSEDGVTPIACARYIWTGTGWEQLDETQVSLDFKWENIQNKPTSTVVQIDDAVLNSHKHTNKYALDKIDQSDNGNFMYNGVEIGIKVIFVDTEKELPSIGDEDTLYISYSDSRVRNYPSVSVYRDGAYQILGRGTQDAPQQVGDMEILQNEFFSVQAGKSFIITVTSNQYFSFLPIEILKKTEGLKAQDKVLFNTDFPDKFDYDDSVISITKDKHITINIKSLPLELDTVSDRYLLYKDVDLSKYKDITFIG